MLILVRHGGKDLGKHDHLYTVNSCVFRITLAIPTGLPLYRLERKVQWMLFKCFLFFLTLFCPQENLNSHERMAAVTECLYSGCNTRGHQDLWISTTTGSLDVAGKHRYSTLI